MAPSEVGSGQVAIFPTFRGFRRAVVREVDGATADGARGFRRGLGRAGTDTGREMGRGFRRAFVVDAGQAPAQVLRQLTGEVARASRQLSQVRLREQDAIGRVRVAEASLADARARGAAGSARVVAAEERLASAQRNLAAAQTNTVTASTTLRSAQDALTRATENTSRSAGRLRGVMSSALSGVSTIASGAASGMRRAFDVAFSGVRTAASSTAALIQSSFSSAGLAAAAVVGSSLVGGFSRLSQLEQASAKLRAFGNDTATVTQIVADANAAVLGTSYGLDEAATVAAAAVAAGIKPGKELEGYLRLTANAAAATGRPLREMGAILNKTTTQGRAYTLELNQLADAGVDIYSKVADEMGVSKDALRDLVAEGKVDAETYRRAVARAVGNAAEELGNTFSGAFSNARAASRRFGAALFGSALQDGQIVGGLYPIFTELFKTIRSGFDSATAAVFPFTSTLFTQFSDRVIPVLRRATGWFDTVKQSVTGLTLPDLNLGQLVNLGVVLAPVIGGLLGLLGPLLTRLPLVGALFAGVSAPAGLVVGILVSLFASSENLRSAFGDLLSLLGEIAKSFLDVAGPVVRNELLPALSDAAKMIGDSLADVIRQIVASGVLPELAVGFVLLLGAITPLLPEILDLVPALLELLPPLVDLVEVLLPPLVDLLGVLLPPAVKILTTVLDGLIEYGLKPVAENLQIFADAMQLVRDYLSGDIDAGQYIAGIEALGGAASFGLDQVKALVGGIEAFVIIVRDRVELVLAVFDRVREALAIVTQLWTQTWANLGLILGGFIMIVSGLLTGNTETVRAGFDRIRGIVTQIWSDTWARVQAILSGAIARVIAVVSALWAGVQARFQQGVSEAVQSTNTLPQRVIDALSGAIPRFAEIGRNMIRGLIGGIQEMAGRAAEAARNVAESALNGAKSWLGIQSPSRRFRLEVGRQAGAGFVLGVEDSVGAAQAAIQQMTALPTGGRSQVTSARGGDQGGNVTVGTLITHDPDEAVSKLTRFQRRARQANGELRLA